MEINTNTLSSLQNCQAYNKLLEMSEMPNTYLTGDPVHNIEHAFARILRYGNCEDVACAAKHYIHFFTHEAHA